MRTSEVNQSWGWSNFALQRHRPRSGRTYIDHPEWQAFALRLVRANWESRQPGSGETGLDRKVVVPVPSERFRCGSVLITEQMKRAWITPIRSRVVQRQPGEDFYVSNSVRRFWAWIQRIKIVPEPATFAKIVCYNKEALLENGGERSTNCEWEIVALLASPVEQEPMEPLTMARNMLEKLGGTKSTYSDRELAESIYYWSQRIKL